MATVEELEKRIGDLEDMRAIDSASLAGNPLGANAAVEWSFMTPPADIPADQITGTEDVDVLVVGCGFAGAIASVAAAQEGAKTLCIDKCNTYSGRGGHITAYGSRFGWARRDAPIAFP